MKSVVALAFVLASATLANAAPPTDADLETCLGKTGSEVAAFSSLHRGMTTDEATAAMPGAGKVDKYGFATVKTKTCVGVSQFKFFYMKDKTTGALSLANGKVAFDKKLATDKDFYSRLVAVLATKYGAVKDHKDVDAKLITWANRDGLFQLSTLGPGGSLELSASIKK